MIRLRILPVLLLSLAMTGGLAAEAAKPIAITHVRIFDGARTIADGTVVIEGWTIRAVGPKVAVPAGAEVIDGSGDTLLPGLIDGHTHTWGDALTRAAIFGVTTELDMFTSPDFARKRGKDHLPRFIALLEQLTTTRVDEPWLARIEAMDNIFPDINYHYWA